VLLAEIIALGQDDKQRLQDPPRRQQIIKRAERSSRRRLDRAPQVGPPGRDQQMAAVWQHQDQLQHPPAAHPPHQLKRAALPRMTRAHHPHRRREAIEVGLVSCPPSPASTSRGF